MLASSRLLRRSKRQILALGRGARITPTVDPRGTHKSITYQIHSRLERMKVFNRLAGKVREIRYRLLAVNGRGSAQRSHRSVRMVHNRDPIGARARGSMVSR